MEDFIWGILGIMFVLGLSFMLSEMEEKSNNTLDKVTLSDTELVNKCRDWITKLCRTGGKAWCLRVPVDLENDPDVLFEELIKRYEKRHE